MRHHLARPTTDVARVAGELVGLHSSDPSSVYLSARARVRGFQAEALERALYEDRSLVRILGMRRTLFVVPRDLASTIDAGCTRDLALPERRKLVRMIEEQRLAPDGDAFLDDVSGRVLASLQRRGAATAAELKQDVEELSLKLMFGEGKKWGGEVGISTRILFLLATEGEIVRARPRGSWRSGQYRWAPIDQWVGTGLDAMDPREARAALVGRWLASFGPGTFTDIKWWTGWTVAKTRTALTDSSAAVVQVDGGDEGYVLADDIDPPGRAEVHAGWVAFLPSLDPTIMGWKERAWYLGDHADRLFDRNGNAGPTIWLDGKVVGGWAQRAGGEVVYRLLDDVGSEAFSLIAAEAAALQSWLGRHRVIPRFRTPLDRELAD